MAIVKATLAKDDDNGNMVYVYPRTSADIVRYDDTMNIKEKIDSISNSINEDSDNTRLFAIDGILNIEWEIGAIAIDSDGSLYTNDRYQERIRVKNSNTYRINKGTFIYLSSYADYSLRVYTSINNAVFTEVIINGIPLKAFLADSDCYCTFSIISKSQSTQTDISAAQLLTTEYDNSMINKFNDLDNELFNQNSRLYELDGNLDVKWEIGGYIINQDGSIKHPDPEPLTAFPRIRSKYGYKYFVKKNTTISLSSYNSFRLLIFTSDDGITFNTSSISLTNVGSKYCANKDTYCIFVIVNKNYENQTNTSAADLFTVEYNSIIYNLNSRLLADETALNVIATQCSDNQINFEGFIGNELVASTTAGKTLTFKFNLVEGHSYRFINLGTSTNTMMLYGGNTPIVDTTNLIERSIGTIQVREFVASANYKYIYVYTAQADSRFSIRDLDAVSYKLEDIPDYYASHMEQKIREINDSADACGLTGDSFVFMTDYHRQANAKNSNRLIRKILDNTGCRFFLFGGDVQDIEDTRSGGVNQLRLFRNEFKDVADKMYCLLGNHEFNPYTLDAQTASQYTVSHSKAYEIMLKDKESSYGGISEYGNYWFDNTAQKIRYICTSCDYASEMPVDSIKWVLTELTNVPNDYSVIILSHLTFDRTSSDTSKAYLRKGIYSVAQALDAYNAREVFTFDGTAFDFSQCSGRALCVIGGHTHFDFDSAQENKILQPDWIPSPLPDTMVIATTTDAYKRQLKSIQPLERELHTVKEHAFDVVHVNTQLATVHMFRIGAGHNRIYHLNILRATGTLFTELSGTVVWTSSDTAVAIVSGGVVTAVGSGRTRILATDEAGNTETWTIKL